MPERLTAFLQNLAPDVAPVPILQPADPFLDTAGEDLRRRIFITETADGALMCLRPDFTIPICLHHVEQHAPASRYAYGGTVFRQGREGAVEFQQAGLEDLGQADTISADAASLSNAIEALGLCGFDNPSVTLGDQNLFAAIVRALEVPAAQAHRLERNFGAPDVLEELIVSFQKAGSEPGNASPLSDLVLAGDDTAFVGEITRMMETAGISPKSGRSPEDIAQRMMAKSTEAEFRLSPERANTLRDFLNIEAPMEEAVDALQGFAAASKVDFGNALETFSTRIELLRERGIAMGNFTYRASFGRKLDYYTGMLFEARAPDGTTLAGGGRYDRLCSILGAEKPVPAVGFSIMMDRVFEAGGKGR